MSNKINNKVSKISVTDVQKTLEQGGKTINDNLTAAFQIIKETMEKIPEGFVIKNELRDFIEKSD